MPSRRDDVTVAALGAAVLIALQLTVTHWFYLYLVWFLPLLLIALLTPERPQDLLDRRRPARSAQRTSTALIQGSSSDGS